MANLIFRKLSKPRSMKSVVNYLFQVRTLSNFRFFGLTISLKAATDAKMQDRIRQIVQRYLTRDVRLLNLAFEPHERRWWFSAKLTEVKYQGVV